MFRRKWARSHVNARRKEVKSDISFAQMRCCVDVTSVVSCMTLCAAETEVFTVVVDSDVFIQSAASMHREKQTEVNEWTMWLQKVAECKEAVVAGRDLQIYHPVWTRLTSQSKNTLLN